MVSFILGLRDPHGMLYGIIQHHTKHREGRPDIRAEHLGNSTIPLPPPLVGVLTLGEGLGISLMSVAWKLGVGWGVGGGGNPQMDPRRKFLLASPFLGIFYTSGGRRRDHRAWEPSPPPGGSADLLSNHAPTSGHSQKIPHPPTTTTKCFDGSRIGSHAIRRNISPMTYPPKQSTQMFRRVLG